VSADPIISDEYKWGFSQPENYVFKSRKGLDHAIVEQIAQMKNEPQWLRDFRHRALDLFLKRPMPNWGGNLGEIDFQDIYYYIKPMQDSGTTWDEVPADIRDTFDKLGIPEAERKYLAGVGSQYECLSGDTRVYTARGLVPIREIQPGDTVFSFDEEANRIIPAKVRATAEKGEREVFEVRVGNRMIRATANHPFLALAHNKEEGRIRGRYNCEWKYLSDLSVGDLVGVVKDLPETGTDYRLAQPVITTQVTGHSMAATATATLPRIAHVEFHGYVKIDSITPAGTEMVYDIEVEGPHNFVAEGLIVHNSEVVYHKVRADLEAKGVIFVDPDTAFREYEEIFRPYFATVIPPNDNKFAALNSAVFSGGSFIYVPKGVSIDLPLQAYFRINAQNMGQFERTLIIADEGSYVHYVEGCFMAGARVRTRDGEKLIEEIREGDEVLTHKGRYRKVTHTMARPYQGDIYHIALADHTLHVTEEHPLLIVRNPAERSKGEQPLLEWVFAAQVKTGDYLVAPSEKAATIQVAPQDFWRVDDRFTYLPVQSITVEQMDTTVYNLSVDEDETYVAEGVISHNCTAPTYTTDSLHSAVVEIIVKRDARVRYTTIQNWSKNVYNLVTKRAQAYANATMEWVDGNLGCLVGDATITTPEGVKPIEDVEVGDKVLSYDDSTGELTFRAVTAKRFSGMQPVHTVSVGERKIQVTANHPFYSYRIEDGQPRFGYVRADHLKEAIVPRLSETSHHGGRTAVATKVALPEMLEMVQVHVSEPSAEPVPTWDIEVEGTGNFVADGFIVHNSKLTMKYPAVWLMEPGARGEVLSVAFASDGQHQDAGGKMVHVAPHTSSTIVSKSISKGAGRASYRGLLKVQKGAHHVKSNVRCDALLLDEQSRTDTYPYMEIEEEDVEVGHEASVSKVGEEQLFYLMSRGIPESEAYTMIVSGFIEPIVKELPLEYAVELNRLIQLEMSGSVG
jgi:Fe-S cluster assembly scaffold protein SufB